ncbi:DUF3365 domain-containing protein [Poseidonocella sp. HB161398]|uniref:Tll0287-like domain-containing protein n=1 Tax=Poseidonocella sp. HB161398 TaxID=2320855 RepID=UPI0011098ECB|nr:DUF3365 domain-containing protein [Poseidonocella sp. HB161398]
MKMRAKFNLALIAAFLPAFALTLAVSAFLIYRNVERQLLHEVAILSAQSDVIRRYTSREVTPLLTAHPSGTFLPQSVPFWVLYNNYRDLEAHLPAYSVRYPTLNPTNPANAPEPWQAELIAEFRADPALGEQVVERDTDAGRMLSVVRPVSVSDPACLECHSSPEAAPPGYTDLFGGDGGFGWELGEVVGAEVITVPMKLVLTRASGMMTTLSIGLLSTYALMMAVLNLLLQRVVIAPVRALRDAAADVSFEDADVRPVEIRGEDEVAELAAEFNRLRGMLANAVKMLEPGS